MPLHTVLLQPTHLPDKKVGFTRQNVPGLVHLCLQHPTPCWAQSKEALDKHKLNITVRLYVTCFSLQL